MTRLSAILALALGLGANIGAFSALRTLLLNPLPYPDPDRLVSLYETTVDRKPRGVSEANLLDWRARTTAFQALAAYQPRSFGLTLTDTDSVTVIQSGMSMSGLFPVMGVAPSLGRTFTEQEEFSDEHLVILTDRLWRSTFSASPTVLGRKLFLNEEPFTIIGVMPPGFEFPMERVLPDLFIPLSHSDYCCGRLGSQDAVARLKPGVSLDTARSQLESVAAALASEFPATNRRRSAGFRPLDEAIRGNRREPLVLLVFAAAMLLAIAIANVAGLVLARCLSRTHEMAIRTALGANLSSILRLFAVESAKIAVSGAALGLYAALLVLRIVPLFVPGAAQGPPLVLDGAAFLFAAILAVAVTLLLAAFPGLLMRRTDLSALIRAGGRQSTAGNRSRVRAALVLAQIALSVVLLLGAGVMVRSLTRLLGISPGFETTHAISFGIGLPGKRYDTSLKEIAFHRALAQKLAELPGVESAGAVGRLPLRGGIVGLGGTFQFSGAGIPLPQRPHAWVNSATPGYFPAMSIPLLEGRDFSWRDDKAGQNRVAIVNQSFARAFLKDRRALGTLLDVRWINELNPDGVSWEIVGVVGDTRQATLDHDPVPEIFLSVTQVGMDGGSYVVRVHDPSVAMEQSIARTVAAQDPRIEQVHPHPLAVQVERSVASRSETTRLLAAFGVLALLLTALGIYAIVAFRAAQRSREMAIRAALGATAPEIRNLVLAHGLRLAAAGTAAGVGLFLLLSPLLRGQLYGVAPADPATIGAVSLAVTLSALVASIAPGRRASRSAPMDLLRES